MNPLIRASLAFIITIVLLLLMVFLDPKPFNTQNLPSYWLHFVIFIGIVVFLIVLYFRPETRYARWYGFIITIMVGLHTLPLFELGLQINQPEWLNNFLFHLTTKGTSVPFLIAFTILSCMLIILDYLERKNPNLISKPSTTKRTVQHNSTPTLTEGLSLQEARILKTKLQKQLKSIASLPKAEEGIDHVDYHVSLGICSLSKSGYGVKIDIHRDPPNLTPILKKFFQEQTHGYCEITAVTETTYFSSSVEDNLEENDKIIIGSTISGKQDFKSLTGTLGLFVVGEEDNKPMLLTCTHLLDYKRSSSAPLFLKKGQEQEIKLGYMINDLPPQKIADLGPLSLVKVFPEHIKAIDSSSLLELGRLQGVATYEDIFTKLGETVYKVSKKGVSKGIISAFDLDSIAISNRDSKDNVYLFNKAIEIMSTTLEPFARSGDSGALVVTSNFKALGIIFAGGKIQREGESARSVTYLASIYPVLQNLGLDLA